MSTQAPSASEVSKQKVLASGDGGFQNLTDKAQDSLENAFTHAAKQIRRGSVLLFPGMMKELEDQAQPQAQVVEGKAGDEGGKESEGKTEDGDKAVNNTTTTEEKERAQQGATQGNSNEGSETDNKVKESRKDVAEGRNKQQSSMKIKGRSRQRRKLTWHSKAGIDDGSSQSSVGFHSVRSRRSSRSVSSRMFVDDIGEKRPVKERAYVDFYASKCMEPSGGDFWANYNVAISKHCAGDFKGAIKHYRRALKKDPGDITVAYNLSVLIDIEARGKEFRLHGSSPGAINLPDLLDKGEGKLSTKIVKYYDALLYSIGGSLDSVVGSALDSKHEEGRGMDIKGERIALLEGIISRVEGELFRNAGGLTASSSFKIKATQEFAQSNLQNLQKIRVLRDSCFDMAVIRHRQANLSSAVEYYTKALKIDPGFREARACLGAVLYQIGSAVIIDPKSEFADIRDTITPEMKQAVIHFRRLMNGKEDEAEAKATSNCASSGGTDVNERQFLITESIDFVLDLEEDEVPNKKLKH